MTLINEIATHSDGLVCAAATTSGDCPSNHHYSPDEAPTAGAKGLLISTDGQVVVAAFTGLDDYQRAVGGYIETVELGGSQELIANEEGLIYGLPLNALASSIALRPILGNAILIGFNSQKGEFADVDENLADSIRQMYRD